ncbi:MAG: hypothetical protein RI897_1699 [Verrucomicrobiota bacterium]
MFEVGVGFDLLEDLEAVDFGEAEVEEDEVWAWGWGWGGEVALVAQVIEGFLAVADMGEEVSDAEVFQVTADDFGMGFVVFDEEDMDGFAFDHRDGALN